MDYQNERAVPGVVSYTSCGATMRSSVLVRCKVTRHPCVLVRSVAAWLLGIVLVFAVAMQHKVAAEELSYSAESTEGWVVDSETGQPLPGVIVIADWSLEGGETSSPIGGELVLLETETDQNGRYFFPAWGPKVVTLPDEFLWNRDPLLIFLKSGYRDVARSNGMVRGPARVREQVRVSTWNGKQIPMTSYHGDEAKAAEDFNYRSDIRRMIGSGKDCEWRQMPLTVAFLLREGARFKRLGQKVYLFNPVSFANQNRCGSAQAWVDGLPK